MANVVMGAMGNLVPKLYELLKEEYKLQTGVKERIRSLTRELEGAQTALCEVADLPWDQVDKQVQLWAGEVREASYDMEDVLDTFLVRVHGPDSAKQEESLFKRLKKVVNLLKSSKVRRKITGDVEDIMTHLKEVTERCRRYKVHDIVAKPAKASPIDPRLHAMYNKVEDLVGIDKSSGELISILQSPQREGASNLKMKIVVIAGVGGLGKTTLAKAVYDKLQGDFDCTAFVPVGRKPNPQEVIQGILIQLDNEKYMNFNFAACRQIYQFINELRKFLREKRYFIVIDDLWEKESWETIKLAFDDNNCDSRIIITTRNREVSEKGYEVYDLRPLTDDSSRELFFIRIGGHEGKLVDNKPDDVAVKFLMKCAGIPLAIITMASLLAGKPREKWDELYRTLNFGSEGNDQSQNTMRTVSFSYYDLLAHLRTCLLYLSAFPEDSVINQDALVWMWVAEGFVEKKQGMRLFETGQGYIGDLINRSMLETVECRDNIVDHNFTGCRVHDMVLDFIRSMSHQENFFSVVLDNDQGKSNNVPRRLAHHDRTLGHGHREDDGLKMGKVRSLVAISCCIEALTPFHGFTLLRVLVIDNCKATEGNFCFRLEHVRHLLHLRLLSISRTSVDSIPEEIGCLRFLQDLGESYLEECPSLGSLPEQLLYLSLPLHPGTIMHSNDGISSLMRLTSLEELSICVSGQLVSWRLPTELRVLQLRIRGSIEAATTERGFWEFVHHLKKLEHLTISAYYIVEDIDDDCGIPPIQWPEHPARIQFCKLPSCFNASCLPNLSHLDLTLEHMDEHDLKILGMLPELRFLCLALWPSQTVSSVFIISEKDAAVVYFPKLRCCELVDAMVSLHANEEDKTISFHVWSGGQARPTISCSTGGGASACATGGGAPRNCFMPCLQVFRFLHRCFPGWDYLCCNNLSFEYGLPSLREIRFYCDSNETGIRAALRSAAEAHPNRPVFRDGPWW